MNMTGDPNQQNRPSVFAIEYNYPPSSPVDWTKFMPSSTTFPTTEYSPFSFSSNVRSGSPVQFPFATNIPTATPHSVHPCGDFGDRSLHIPLRCKRKTDSPPPADLPQKQFITDEKMAEHMSHLHINSETTAVTESQPVREQRLYLCEEMRRLQQESILPQSLLNRIHRPCTALVLWTPPSRGGDEEAENNNDEDVLDNNVMDLDAIN